MTQRDVTLVWGCLALSLGGCGLTQEWPPTPTPSPTPTATAEPDPLAVRPVGETSALPGGVVLVEERGQPNFVVSTFRFDTQAREVVFQVPSASFVFDVDAAPSGQWGVMAWAAPAEEGANPYDRGGLYRLDLSGGAHEPTLLLAPGEAGEYTHLPEVSADGAWIYFIGEGGAYEAWGDAPVLCRLPAAGGEVDLGPVSVTEPAAAHTSGALAYVRVDRATGDRSLVTVSGWGGEERALVAAGALYDLGLPHFSADDAYVYFVVIEDPSVARRGVLGRLASLGVAEAHGNHDLPGVWMRVPAAGGEAEAVTETALTTYDGGASADGAWFAFTGGQGFYAEDLSASLPGDGALFLSSRAIKAVDWLP